MLPMAIATRRVVWAMIGMRYSVQIRRLPSELTRREHLIEGFTRPLDFAADTEEVRFSGIGWQEGRAVSPERQNGPAGRSDPPARATHARRALASHAVTERVNGNLELTHLGAGSATWN